MLYGVVWGGPWRIRSDKVADGDVGRAGVCIEGTGEMFML